MNNLEIAVIFLILALAGIVVRKTYYFLPPLEMKRRASKGDELAANLFKAVAYGDSLRVLLWVYIGITSAAGLVLLSKQLPIIVSLIIVSVLLWLAFSLIPSTKTTSLGVRLSLLATPGVAWVLNYVAPSFDRAAQLTKGHYVADAHTRLFERSDLVELIEKQKHQEDSRFSEGELEIVKRALHFDEHKVRDILTPKKSIKTIIADDAIGPILIDEVHKSGQEYVLVREKPKGQVVGTLAFNKLSIRSKGFVRNLMDKNVYYLNEDDNLEEVINAYFVTGSPTYIVIDNAEDFIGLVTIENVIRHLMGDLKGTGFDKYDNAQAVATRHLIKAEDKEIHEELVEAENTPVKTDEEVVE